MHDTTKVKIGDCALNLWQKKPSAPYGHLGTLSIIHLSSHHWLQKNYYSK